MLAPMHSERQLTVATPASFQVELRAANADSDPQALSHQLEQLDSAARDVLPLKQALASMNSGESDLHHTFLPSLTD